MSEVDWVRLKEEADVAKSGDYVDRGVEWADRKICEQAAEIARMRGAFESPVAYTVGNTDGTVNRLGAVYYFKASAQRHIDSYTGDLDAVVVPLYTKPVKEVG